MVCYFKRICGINQAEDRVTWPDFLHRHTIALASFREWSVVSARLRIRAQPRNPCRARNSASAWTWSRRTNELHLVWMCTNKAFLGMFSITALKPTRFQTDSEINNNIVSQTGEKQGGCSLFLLSSATDTCCSYRNNASLSLNYWSNRSLTLLTG